MGRTGEVRAGGGLRLFISEHARRRMDARGIRDADALAAFDWGTGWRHGGRLKLRVDRAAIARARRDGADIRAHEGVTIVVAADGFLVTAYRNRRGERVWR